MYTKKVFFQKLLQVSSKEEGQTAILHTFLLTTFLLAKISHFSQQFRNQRKILSCFETKIQILRRKNISIFFKKHHNRCTLTDMPDPKLGRFSVRTKFPLQNLDLCPCVY